MNIRAPWEIFENLNEIVYAVDMDTYDIIYLNKAAMTALQTTPEEYSREKCYRLFGKFSSPCHFCTNPKLREGEFVEWGYYNPHLKRAFKLKDTMYCHEGRRVRVEIAIDMMLNEIENKGLDDRVQDKIFINSCLELTHSASTPDESMNFLIQYLGQHKECQGIDIYEVQKNNWLYHTYRWSAETGIDTVTVPFQIDFLQSVPLGRSSGQTPDTDPGTPAGSAAYFYPVSSDRSYISRAARRS